MAGPYFTGHSGLGTFRLECNTGAGQQEMAAVSSLWMNEEERRDQGKETDTDFLKIVVKTAKMPSKLLPKGNTNLVWVCVASASIHSHLIFK